MNNMRSEVSEFGLSIVVVHGETKSCSNLFLKRSTLRQGFSCIYLYTVYIYIYIYIFILYK